MFKVNDNSKEKSIFPSKCENHHFLFELFCPILENRKIQVSYKKCFIHVGGYYTPNQNLAWFALYLKIITIFFCFFEKIIYVSYSKLSKELKNRITI